MDNLRLLMVREVMDRGRIIVICLKNVVLNYLMTEHWFW